jgi:Tfp pilus assembly protein PilF
MSNARIEQLLELLKTEAQDVFLNYALGMDYLADVNTILLAETQFKKVIALDENYIAAYYQLGKLYENQTKITEALSNYRIGLDKAKRQKNNKAINEFGEAIFMLED